VASTGERDAVAQVIETSALSGVLFFTDWGGRTARPCTTCRRIG
jgi:hypothetical protein